MDVVPFDSRVSCVAGATAVASTFLWSFGSVWGSFLGTLCGNFFGWLAFPLYDFLMASYGFPMVPLWIPVVFSWFPYGFLQFSNGFLVVFNVFFPL